MPASRLLFSLSALPLLAISAAAQGPTLRDAQSALRSCTYDTCALRLSTHVFRGVTVRRGLNGSEEWFGFAGGALARAVSTVPAAEAEARIGRRRYITGGIAAVVGALASTALALLATRGANSAGLTRNLWIGSGAMGGVAFYGSTQLARGDESFSRAVWMYNRELSR
jgi:hypothetical protein